ncbi:MAG TPA: hypothetical protein VMW29_02200 [Candidatus Bathyarchaeia archaeon]|nr:hypothetical protein [Candidatus Bathyarchaeia archaeon]
MNKKLLEIIGWYGTIAIIGAYALLSFNLISSQSAIYQLLNVTGAVGIVIISLKKKVYQPAVLNIIWTVIGMVALLQLLF